MRLAGIPIVLRGKRMNIEKLNLAGLTPGVPVNGVGLIKNVDTRKTKNGAEFLSGEITDGSTVMAFKKWQANPADKALILSGKGIMIVAGEVSEYQGSLDLKINKYTILPDEEVAVMNLIPESAISVDKLEESWAHHIDALTEAGYLMAEMIEFLEKGNIITAYKTYAGAKSVHHDYKYGLLEHVTNTASIAVDICRNIPYPVNVNAVRFAALFHDIGKVQCYNFVNNLAVDISKEFMLMGHLYAGAAIISKLRKWIPVEDLEIIIHCVLSHHDKPEWGAVVPPAIMEARVVASADLISSAIPMYKPENNPVKPVYLQSMGHSVLK